MICKNCGGELRFQRENGICINCGSVYKTDIIFENTEVCVLSINFDDRGIKTRDNFIAKEIFSELEAAKVNTFYEVVSADNVTGDYLEILRLSAIQHSSVILLIGTTSENFNLLSKRYYDLIKQKKIIPVLCDVKPEQLPSELKKFQAINYNSIGAYKDLINGVYALLGKEETVDVAQIQEKASNKKAYITGVIIAALIVFISVGIFWWNDFFVTKDIQEQILLTNEQRYENAQILINEGKYREAIDIFTEIIDYKESKTILKNIYDKFDGYYSLEDGEYELVVDIQNINTATISLTKIISSTQRVMFKESCAIEGAIASIQYIDNYSNTGEVKVELKNDGVIINVTSNSAQAINFDTTELYFKLSSLTDKPTIGMITKQTVIEWLDNRVSLNTLKQLGYEFEFECAFVLGYEEFNWANMYKIKGQEVLVVFVNYDVYEANAYSDSLLDYWDWCKYSDGPDVPLADPVAYAIISSGQVLFPEQIGKPCDTIDNAAAQFVANVRNSGYLLDFPEGIFTENAEEFNVIKPDMYFAVTTNKSTGNNS